MRDASLVERWRRVTGSLYVEEDEATEERIENEYHADGQVYEAALEEGMSTGLVGHATEAEAAHLRILGARWLMLVGMLRLLVLVVVHTTAGRSLQRGGIAVVGGLETLVGPVAAGWLSRVLLHLSELLLTMVLRMMMMVVVVVLVLHVVVLLLVLLLFLLLVRLGLLVLLVVVVVVVTVDARR